MAEIFQHIPVVAGLQACAWLPNPQDQGEDGGALAQAVSTKAFANL